ncbi:hypothetical protein TNCV_4630781 [Trichonephila clavipes]|nr:hypothetical protein TNCV_4630781 [Trichonephila clavipes]
MEVSDSVFIPPTYLGRQDGEGATSGVSDPKQTFPPLAGCLTTLSRSSCCTDQSPADDKESARGGLFLIIDIRTMSIHDGEMRVEGESETHANRVRF